MSQNKFWKEFRREVRLSNQKHDNEIARLSIKVNRMEEKDNSIFEKIDNILSTLSIRDNSEALKYESIDIRLRDQSKFINIGIGIAIAMNALGFSVLAMVLK